MDFTREPIIETVVTPREGCKLVVRSSKGTGQEEYFVDAVEIVSFGHSFFFRSLERPKMFFVPASDYEILEVREARMVLKNVAPDRTIKIRGGREPARQPREQNNGQQSIVEEEVDFEVRTEESVIESKDEETQGTVDKPQEPRQDKKRERRRQSRRRRGRDSSGEEEGELKTLSKDEIEESTDSATSEKIQKQPLSPPVFTGLLPPPPLLISDTLARYRENAEFKDAFYPKGEQKAAETTKSIIETTAETQTSEEVVADVVIEAPVILFEPSVEQEESIYLQRKAAEELSRNESPENFDLKPHDDDHHNDQDHPS